MLSVVTTSHFSITASAEMDGYYVYTPDNEVTITDVDTSISGDIIIPNTLGGCKVTSIGSSVFKNCTSLESITIPDSVTSIVVDAFSKCSTLTTIIVADNNSYYSSQDGVLFNKTKTELIKYPEGKTDVSYTIPNDVTSLRRLNN